MTSILSQMSSTGSDHTKDEKIDVIHYSEDPAEYISAALNPAKVLSVEIDEKGSTEDFYKVKSNVGSGYCMKKYIKVK